MKIKYLYHSGFLVGVEDTGLVFDYCEHSGDGKLENSDIEAFKNKYLFLSHSHSDHYTQEAFFMPFDGAVMSEDFPQLLPGTHVRPGMTVKNDVITIRVFGSTDMGVSYLVTVGEKNIFHAGDFNFWHWDEESDDAYVAEAKRFFESVLEPIKEFKGQIDLAFFPVDKRLGKNCGKGAELFIKAIEPKVLIPMHTSDESGKTALDFAKNDFSTTKIIAMIKRGETIEI